MATEQSKTLAGLQLAIQMETDGKMYYQKAAEISRNQLGRQLFQSLAADEDIHRQEFEEIYGAISSKKGWIKTDYQPGGGRKLRTIFSRAVEEIGTNIKALPSELDAVKRAIDMEIKSYELYKSRSQATTYDVEREFYEAVAAEERGHHLILLDYQEYLSDPAGWFVTKEHPSLDLG